MGYWPTEVRTVEGEAPDENGNIDLPSTIAILGPMTQATFDTLTPDADTLYIISG